MIEGLFRRRRRKKEVVAQNNREKVLLPFSTDLHSHLIPGIDDGAVEMEESLDLLLALREIGYRRIVTTPHVMADSYRNSSQTIREGCRALSKAAESRGIVMEISAAAEYYMDEELLRRLQAKDILTIGGEYLLFETSYYSHPFYLEESIYEIAASGYRPLMAHPERYRYVRDPERFYGRLRDLGVVFQVNINSFGGHYGDDARKKAWWLAEKGWISFLGSDLHHLRQAEFLRENVASGLLVSLLQKNDILNDTLRFSVC